MQRTETLHLGLVDVVVDRVVWVGQGFPKVEGVVMGQSILKVLSVLGGSIARTER